MDLSKTLGIEFQTLLLILCFADVLFVGILSVGVRRQGKAFTLKEIFILVWGVYILLFFIALIIDMYIAGWKGLTPPGPPD